MRFNLSAYGVFLFGVLGPLFVHADDQSMKSIIEVEESLGLIRNVHLVVDDQVDDKCWTNSDQIKQKARLTLEQSGIRVYEEPLFIISPFSSNIVISGLGQRTESGICFGKIEVDSYREVFTDFSDVSIKYYGSNFSRSSVAINSRNLDASFLSSVDTFISQFSSDVFAGRRNEHVGNILNERGDTKPVTMSEFIKMFEEASKEK